MAILKSETKQIEIPDGTPIQLAADELGVMFGCRHGMCGTCQTEVIEGIENLSEPNENEQAMGATGPFRLCCQAEIKKGTVKLRV
jgi:ferredoxin